MNLQFDSISELEQFLMFAAHIGNAFATQAPAGDIAPNMIKSTGAAAPLTSDVVPENSHGVEPVSQGEDGALLVEPVATETRPKRIRRTKAEMEAARAGETSAANAEAAPSDTSAMTIADVAGAASTPAGTNPFAVASPATQAILEAPNQSAATLAGMAAMQSNPPVDAPAPRVIESIEHLRACQAFIQAHGMTKYNESFQGGLNANIAAYTPEQRAQHIAVLETLGV